MKCLMDAPDFFFTQPNVLTWKALKRHKTKCIAYE